MNRPVMNIVQQAPLAEHLCLGNEARAQSITLRTGRHASVLKVERGMAWVTLPATASQAPQDLWLQAGQSLPLAAQQTLWVDGWPHAELSVEVVQQQAPASHLLRGLHRLTARFKRQAVTSSAGPLPRCVA
jgi:hypothetical protein